MTISNSNLLKPFITGSKLLPFKDDVFSKTEEQFKKSPHGKSLFISGNENLVNISAEKIDEIKNSKSFFSNIVNIIILLIKHPDKILPILHGCPAESIEFIKNAKRTGQWSYEMTDKYGQSIEVSYIFTDTIDNKSDGKLCLKICNSCNQNDSSTHEYKIDHQQLKNHIKQLEEWALLEKFYDNNAYYSKRTKQLEKKITDAGFITGKVNAENFNVTEFKDDITSMLCEQPPLRTHQISSSGYVSADKLPKLYELNLKDAQRDLKTTPVDIDGVSLKFKTRERIAEEIAKKTAGKTAEKNSEIIAKQNANSIEEKNIEKNKKETNPEDNFVLKFSQEEINEMLLDYSDEEQKKLRPFFTSDHIYCLFDAFSQCLYNVARDGSPRYAGLLQQIASKCAILQDFDQQLFWRTFSGGVFHRRISVNSEPEKTDVWRFSTQFDFPHINDNGELSRTVLMFEGVAESNFKDIANHSSECFSYSCYAAPLDVNAKK
ncbi:hypothetical protein GP910_10775 [Escherichia coli]|uniref:hypothetical protein n=1 Tax=Escherichia coli TaxID=562 RepID=UPI000B8025C9|nr:hypothetical protein [Escherichia coli]KAE9757299.1 hypothetical protein GP728_13645 [Enterobacteriaceae bacterium TzEc084]KAE9895756.1 hypothetical protein GP696_16215 [Enterobacteriaceae bacterium TzEc052]MVX76549.1 hypothetical protein [Enterobacteriaceae bacterium 8376wD9]MVY07357.1 hypothetical protein [Enterobacteriaceae bacterium 8376wH8]MVY27703.1 hypothetical protein [Enterobacteriaceae bacterium 8376wD8]MVY91869.1 hypothetical protein [Enterobacteriaceae bacterium 8376wD7]MVZ069